MEELMLYSL